MSTLTLDLEDVERQPPASTPYVAGSETSQAAAAAVTLSDKARQYRLILAALRRAGADGLTDLEIQKVTGLAGDTVRPRRGELVKRLGLVVRTLRQRETESSRKALVNVLTEFWTPEMGREERP
jgi:hypothetical protein